MPGMQTPNEEGRIQMGGGESCGWRPPVWAIDELERVSLHLLAWAEVVRMASVDGCNSETVGMLIHDGIREERKVLGKGRTALCEEPGKR